MSACLFSIIIPSYNYGDYLPRAVNSAINQAGHDFEVIVIDDGSTDNTRQIAHQLSAKNSKISYLYQSNKGLAASRNVGVNNTIGEYLIFLDADDELLPDALTHYRNAISAYPDKQFIIGGHQSVNKHGEVIRKNSPQKIAMPTREKLFSAYLFKRLSISAGGYAMHRSIFEKLRFPETLLSTEDIPMYGQVLALFDSVLIEKPTVKIYKHSDSLRHNFAHAQAVGTKVVDVLFDADILPPSFMVYQHSYTLKRYLSLFGLAYRAGAYSLARSWYFAAIQFDKRALFRLSKLKKFILSFAKKDTFNP